MATKKPEELFTVTELTYRDYVHRPRPRCVIGSTEIFSRITFAENPHDAFMLVFPNLRFHEFKRLKFQVWKLQIRTNTKIFTPFQVTRRYGLPFARKYGEWVSFQNQRLEKHAEIIIDESTPYEDIIEIIDDEEKVITRKYLFKI